jgi:hypothetical protein
MIRSYVPQDLPVIMDIANRAWLPIHKMFRETCSCGEKYFEKLSKERQSRCKTVKR